MLVHNYPDAWANVYVGFDLSGTDPIRRAGEKSMTGFQWSNVDHSIPLSRGDRQLLKEIGIASCTERVCQSVSITEDDVSLNKTNLRVPGVSITIINISTPKSV